ncbi:MAG TPA: alpha/beta hydrolase [Candidatus Saccharimonadia bacterium]|nr:alpha/beta hydrolase [Candidatus Saccharimonadia bacterium]
MKPRIIFIHGNQATNWRFAWTPWLKTELEQRGYDTTFETMPDSIIARAEYWLPCMQDFLKIGEQDVIVGWSSGAVAALRYAETHQIRGSVLVSPSYTDLGDALEKQSGYFDKPWDWAAIKANQAHIGLVYGDDDPYIPQAEFEHIAAELQPDVMKVAGGRHFIERQQLPEVLDYIEAKF